MFSPPPCPDEPSDPIVTTFGKVGGMVNVRKSANFGVVRLIDARCAGM